MPGAIQLKHLDLLTQRYCGAVIEVRITAEDKQLLQQIPNIGTNTHFSWCYQTLFRIPTFES